MSELTIEILREKFKEAQSKGEELELSPLKDVHCYKNLIITGFGAINFMARREGDAVETEEAYSTYYLNKYYKIKPPEDEYEVLHEHLDVIKGYLELKKFTQKNDTYQFTGRKLMRNKRTGEIVDFNEELLR